MLLSQRITHWSLLERESHLLRIKHQNLWLFLKGGFVFLKLFEKYNSPLLNRSKEKILVSYLKSTRNVFHKFKLVTAANLFLNNI